MGSTVYCGSGSRQFLSLESSLEDSLTQGISHTLVFAVAKQYAAPAPMGPPYLKAVLDPHDSFQVVVGVWAAERKEVSAGVFLTRRGYAQITALHVRRWGRLSPLNAPIGLYVSTHRLPKGHAIPEGTVHRAADGKNLIAVKGSTFAANDWEIPPKLVLVKARQYAHRGFLLPKGGEDDGSETVRTKVSNWMAQLAPRGLWKASSPALWLHHSNLTFRISNARLVCTHYIRFSQRCYEDLRRNDWIRMRLRWMCFSPVGKSVTPCAAMMVSQHNGRSDRDGYSPACYTMCVVAVRYGTEFTSTRSLYRSRRSA